MASLALFIPVDLEIEAEQVLAEVFGEPQSGSFRKRLSASGLEPATYLGAFAANLGNLQRAQLLDQELIVVRDSDWNTALSDLQLTSVDG